MLKEHMPSKRFKKNSLFETSMAQTVESLLKLKDLRSYAEEAVTERMIPNEAAVRPNDYPGVVETNLTRLTREQRLAFEITVSILCGLSLCGNFGTLYVNSRRKMRPFLRTCLISLALSDLLSTIFLTWTPFAQFTAEYVQIWRLSPVLCRLIPLVTTAAILASSTTLAGIALDRYFAVMKAVVSFWDPSVAFCFIFAFALWIVSFGIAVPVCFIYHTVTVWILTEAGFPDKGLLIKIDRKTESLEVGSYFTLNQSMELVTMCVSDQKDVALYYIIVFSIIFIPCIVAFVWLNSIIAKKIWTRRHRPPQPADKEKVNFPSPNKDTSKPSSNQGSTTTPAGYGSAREARHIRMFIVILVLMGIFLILRLPAWIFLVMRMCGSYTRPRDWLVYFSFAVLNLASCALSPLFYTFLPETLQYISCCRQRFCNDAPKCKAKNCFQSTKCDFDVPCCFCCGILYCFPKDPSCRCSHDNNSVLSRNKTKSKRPARLQRDEGVDFSDDESFDEVKFELRRQEIFVVFSSPSASNYNQ